MLLLGLAIGALAGFWTAHADALPLAGSIGAGIGAALGLALAYVVIRPPHERHPRRVRVRRR